MLVALLLAGCSGAGARPTAHPSGSSTATPFSDTGPATHVIVIPNNDLFSPYIAVVNVGDTVSWINDDTVLHTIVTAPAEAGRGINPVPFQFVVDPGKEAHVLLQQGGLYYYFCDAHAELKAQGSAAARAGVRAYPIPMDGFIYVRDQRISGIPAQTIAMTADNRFVPWLTIVNQAATVTWANQTQRPLDVQGVPGYGSINPAPLTFQVTAGGSHALTFTTPGIYDYYATASAKLDPAWQRPVAREGVAGYPIPMAGVVVVLG